MSLSVLLVVPIREGANVQIAPDAGVLYLGTALQNKGFKVTMLDCSKEGLTFRARRNNRRAVNSVSPGMGSAASKSVAR